VIDVYASAPWYLDHLLPIADALGPDLGVIHRVRPPKVRGHARTRTALVASYGDLRVMRRAGYERFALTQHGAGQSYGNDHPSFPGGRDQGDVELFLVPNQHAAGRWRAVYPRSRIEVVGCPKLDALPGRGPGPGPVVAVSFHWEFRLCPESRSAYAEFAATLPALAEQYRVLGHGHPRRREIGRVWRRMRVEHVPSFADICRRADVYVCDNSSSLFEFAATGRPVVVLNASGYRRDVSHGLRFWDAARVGVNVDRPADLMDGIARALEMRPEDVAARESALDVVYGVRSGSARLAAAAIRSTFGIDTVAA
jgi:hypothetical protein